MSRCEILLGVFALACSSPAPARAPEPAPRIDARQSAPRPELPVEPAKQLETAVAAPSPGPVRAVALAAAASHTCALYDNARVACWGDNGVGQAGGPPTGIRGSDPHWVEVGADVRQIAAGRFLSCALDAVDDVWCWGNVQAGTTVSPGGVTGTTALPDRPEYRDVGKPVRVITSVGEHITRLALSLTTARGCVARGREVVCWNTDTRPAALGKAELNVAGDAEIVDLAVGAERSCALVKQNGKRHVECWQSGGKPGKARLGALGEPVELAMGSLHTCVRDAKGKVGCWRIEVTPDWWTHAPKNITSLGSAARSVTAGGDFACAATLDGAAACFMAEPEGLPDEVVQTAWAAPRAEARRIPGVDHAKLVIAGQQRNVYGHGHACALREDGSVVCWGDNEAGQLGDGKRVTDSGAVSARTPE